MKYIVKGNAPSQFNQWLEKANDDWTPTYDNLQNPEKQALLNSLITEQHSVCCYCGFSITLEDSHIEHFRPQDQYHHLELDYQNIHASCLKNTTNTTPIHCGHAKKNNFDEYNHISPLDVNCETRFRYSQTGEISTDIDNDNAAQEMIRILDLNIGALRLRRKDVLERVFSIDFITTVTPAELMTLAANIRIPKNGRLESFSHVIASYAENL